MNIKGMGDFYDDYGNLVVETDDGGIAVVPQEDTTYQTSGWTPDAVVSVPATPTSSGRPTSQQASAVAAANPAGGSGVVDWLSKLADAVPKALQLYNAQQIASVNIRRAEQGLSPLNPGLYGPQVGVTMSPDTQRMIMYGALGIGALLIIGGGRKR